jgi:hypothetical protein
MIFEIFSPKNWRKNAVFIQTTASCRKNGS